MWAPLPAAPMALIEIAAQTHDQIRGAVAVRVSALLWNTGDPEMYRVIRQSLRAELGADVGPVMFGVSIISPDPALDERHARMLISMGTEDAEREAPSD